ncbi:MAG TPA: OsmC family protein [Myxococcaceae bacterium]|nr:OsmC family protein [Myxococcaceae bacterium]
MTGTFGGALEARQIPAAGDRLEAKATGEVEKTDDGVLVIKRIHVRFRLRAKATEREAAERVHGFFAEKCPLYRTLKTSIAISTELIFEPT